MLAHRPVPDGLFLGSLAALVVGSVGAARPVDAAAVDGARTRSAETTPRRDSPFPRVDPSDPASFIALARRLGIPIEPYEPPTRRYLRCPGFFDSDLEGVRGTCSPSPDEPVVHLTFPRGDVRLSALDGLRVELSDDAMQREEVLAGARLVIVESSPVERTLYDGPFDPPNLHSVQPMPVGVLSRLVPGAPVTWSVRFAGSRSPSSAAFTPVLRDEATERALVALRCDPRLKDQPRAVRLLLEAEALRGFGLHAEAFRTMLDARRDSPAARAVSDRYLAVLVRLGQRRSPLFDDEMDVRASGPR